MRITMALTKAHHSGNAAFMFTKEPDFGEIGSNHGLGGQLFRSIEPC